MTKKRDTTWDDVDAMIAAQAKATEAQTMAKHGRRYWVTKLYNFIFQDFPQPNTRTKFGISLYFHTAKARREFVADVLKEKTWAMDVM